MGNGELGGCGGVLDPTPGRLASRVVRAIRSTSGAGDLPARHTR